MSPIDKVLAKLENVRQSGNRWKACCPAHNDRNPSLSIAVGDQGNVLLTCHAKCSLEEICQAMGIEKRDLWPERDRPQKRPKTSSKIVAEYDYRDETGKVLFQVVRFEPKDFRQRKPSEGGGWDWSVKGVRVIPYSLPDIVGNPGVDVGIPEGERDVDNLKDLGMLATCNAGGAGKWTAEHAAFLAGRDVVIFPDNDEPGRNHAQQVAHTLEGIAKSIRVVKLPGLPLKGDVSDWIAAGGTLEQLAQLLKATPMWEPTPIPESEQPLEPGPILTCLADVEAREVDWLWPGRIPMGRITLLVGSPGEGKSFMTIDATSRVTTGTPWPDGRPCPQGSVILISAEDDPADTIRPRLDAHGADARKVQLLAAVRRVDGEGQRYEKLITLADVDAIESALERYPDCKLIVIDPIGSFLGGKTDAHRDNEVRSVLTPILKLAEKVGAAVLIVAHRRKGAGTSADELALGSRAFTGIARAVWHITRDPDNKERRLFLPGKNNLAHEGEGLAYSISGEPARIVWEADSVAMSADDALALQYKQSTRGKPGPIAATRSEAVDWLTSALASGPRLAKELEDEWKNGEAGSKRTLGRAKRELGIISERHEIPGPWWWRWPDNNASPAEATELGTLGNVEETAGNLAYLDGNSSKIAKMAMSDSLEEPPALEAG
ncbi:hypothetical protein Psta_2746 [Pirellula staleyi DSM 6068]|uniref:RecA-family ATPase-like protein n=1 Tax=Pirellula staleyi (strain ATCC 27377 / DSM 6068 / ICPB 4128) TaxID=530564 RepID=D2R7I7_PIRSD|nr:AAA family ATPase [Pirellula staleyi]ADB17413.1 hypothetical protein Psta_2746 [Pirellula staleyi DSM 6068]